MEGYVYILKCCNNRFYIGSTKNLDNRLKLHQNGKVKSTKNLLPVELVFCQKYCSLENARKMEYKIKRLKSRNIIEKIITDKAIKLI